MPQVSVIVPAYNAESTILATIRSIQQQTFEDWELIVINDGSTDRTYQVLQAIDDPRLKVYSYPNGGLPTARNRGIAVASGEYISFIDADDLWSPDKLELQLQALQDDPEAGVAYSLVVGGLETSAESFAFVEGNTTVYQGNVLPQLLLNNFISCGSNILVRKTAINSVGMFDPILKSCEDWDYYLRLAAKWLYVGVHKAQIIHRKTPGAMTSKAKIMEKEGLITLEKAFQAAPAELQYLKNQSLANYYSYIADLYYCNSNNSQDIQKALQRLWWAIKLYPRLLRDRLIVKLLLKTLLRQFIPAKFFSTLAQLFKKKNDTPDPRYLT